MLRAAFIGYLLGSIPFGLLLTRAAGLPDLRTIGSGNIGATNVLRTGRRDIAALTLLLDAGKAVIAVLLFVGTPSLVAGVAAVIGHLFPAWLRFRGGKGVATGFGVLLAAAWPAALAAALAWAVVAWRFRISSLAALAACAIAPLAAWALRGPRPAIAILAIALLITARHHQNIRRLRAGTEPRLGRTAP